MFFPFLQGDLWASKKLINIGRAICRDLINYLRSIHFKLFQNVMQSLTGIRVR